MILDLDAGNTRIKWRLLGDAGELCGRGSWRSGAPEFLVLEGQPVRRIRLASVLPRNQEQMLLERMQNLWQVEPGLARTAAAEHGVRNAYAEASRLGVDRWLALLAACRLAGERAVCVVDVGTTMTVDMVLERGVHAGGYIVPGPCLMQDAVYGNTGQVLRRDPVVDDSPEPGKSTEQAVAHGAMAALLGAVREGLGWLSGQVEEVPLLLLTGGGGRALLPWLPAAAQYHSDLVLEGLAIQDPAPGAGLSG